MQSINSIHINDKYISELSIRNNKLILLVYRHEDANLKNVFQPIFSRFSSICRTCKLYYLIRCFTKFGIRQIPTEDVFYECITKNHTQLAESKRALREACFIDYSETYNYKEETKTVKGKKVTEKNSEPSVYIVLENPSSVSNPLNSLNSSFHGSLVKYTYSIDNSFLDILRSKVLKGGEEEEGIYQNHFSRNTLSTNEKNEKNPKIKNQGYRTTSAPNDYEPKRYERFFSDSAKSPEQFLESIFDDPKARSIIENQGYRTTSAPNDYEPKRYERFFPIFTSFYDELSYEGPNPIVNYKINESLKKSKCAYHETEHRFFHYFHIIKKDTRKFLILDSEPLVEFFDVHNCHYCLLNALIKNDDSIPQEEKDKFWKLTVEEGKLYEDIASYSNSTREIIKKKGCAQYLDYKNETLHELRRLDAEDNAPKKKVNQDTYKYVIIVDKYFQKIFPNIRKFIYSIKDTDYKALHYKMNEIETNIMVYGIAYELLTKHNIKALTLHDGIYVKESDAAKMKEMNISTEQMFKEKLINY